MLVNVQLAHCAHHLVPVCLSYIHQHVGVAKTGDLQRLVEGGRRGWGVAIREIVITSPLFLDGPFGVLLGHLVIVKLEPLGAVWVDKRIVVSAMHTAAVHQHAVQAVLVGRAAVGIGAEVLVALLVEVKLLVKFIAIVDLCVCVRATWASCVLAWYGGSRTTKEGRGQSAT